MNWSAMLQVIACFAAAYVFYRIGIWMMETKGWHPGYFMALIFLSAVLFAGVATK